MLSGAVFCTSLVWLGGGWVDGACWGTSVEVLEVEADDVRADTGSQRTDTLEGRGSLWRRSIRNSLLVGRSLLRLCLGKSRRTEAQ